MLCCPKPSPCTISCSIVICDEYSGQDQLRLYVSPGHDVAVNSLVLTLMNSRAKSTLTPLMVCVAPPMPPEVEHSL